MSKDLQHKVSVYEKLLHSLYLNSFVTMNEEKIKKLIQMIGEWSFSHRDGEFSSDEVDERIKKSFSKIEEYLNIDKKVVDNR